MPEESIPCDRYLPVFRPALKAMGKCGKGKGKRPRRKSVIDHDHIRSEYPILRVFGIVQGKEASRLRKAAGLDKVAQGLKDDNIQYISHQGYSAVSQAETEKRWDPSISGIQDAKTTIEKGGGDCDDLAVLYAYKLRMRNKDSDLEFGVIHGFLKMRNQMCMPHAVLALRNKRKPNTYHLYEVTNVGKGPEYIGHTDFNKGLYFQKEAASPEENPNFLMNSYVPVKLDGALDFSRKAYFRP